VVAVAMISAIADAVVVLIANVIKIAKIRRI